MRRGTAKLVLALRRQPPPRLSIGIGMPRYTRKSYFGGENDPADLTHSLDALAAWILTVAA